ncbi:helix-turn-helix domain-containing protein [Flavobacterium humi]|uniref:Helix-turn-helix domain-containing protein n=1 Tax=Flavobacterium humi TaxID=2562683 RepID=A0A4Z0LB95_9FLAO|nr:helix-turn-helix domain-containing protein [Flavobacterium humi]TGD59067.1 helix-turn-helix domain-containing protein [Flavobacterium humi]
MKHNGIRFYFLILLFFTIVFANSIVAQTPSKQQSLFHEFEELIHSKPDEALKIGMHLLKNSSSDEEKSEINMLIAEIYKVKGDYSNALNYLYVADKDTPDLSDMNAVKILIAKSAILRSLYLEEKSERYFEEARQKAVSIKEKDDQRLATIFLTLEKAAMYISHQKYEAALKTIENKSKEFEVAKKDSPDLDLWLAINMGKIYSGLGDFEKSNGYFSKARLLLDKGNKENQFAEIFVLNGLAGVNFHKKDHQKAIVLLSESLKIAQNLDNLYLTETISKQLAINYLALNDKANYKWYNANLLKISTQIENAEQESVNTAYNLIAKETENNYLAKKQNYRIQFYVALVLFFLVLIGCTMFWLKFHWKKKRLKEIINYLEVTRNNLVSRYTEKKEASKKVFIPQETEQALLNKLKRFENTTRFTNNDISLAVLSGQFETNTKYLSEIINKHYNVNFNTYINKLRINYIVEKLKSDPNFINYKISYLAETCGFSSHSSFATVFKSITGIAPITFIELLKNEKEIGNPVNNNHHEVVH